MHKKLIIGLMFVILIAMIFITITVPAQTNFNEQDLEQAITQYIETRKEGTASVSLGIFKDGQTIYQQQYGYEDVENKVSVSADSVYEWGSVSKVFVWVAMMQLVEKGQSR